MHIPKQSYIDEKTEKKVQRYVYSIGVLLIIPSVFLAYQIVTESMFESNVQKYINTELIFEDTQVVRTYISEDKNEFNIALLGKRISNDTIELLQNKLENYNLGHLTLKVTQTETTETLDYEAIQSIIEQELNSAHTEVALSDRDAQIEMLKAELVTYKSLLLDYQNAEYDTISLAKEIGSIYPNIKSFSLEQTKSYEIDTDELNTKLIAIIDTTAPLTEIDKDKIKAWISVKTSIESIELYINTSMQPMLNTSSVLAHTPEIPLSNPDSSLSHPSSNTLPPITE